MAKAIKKSEEVAAPETTGSTKDTISRVVAGSLETSVTQAKVMVTAVLEAIVTIMLAQGNNEKPKLSISDFGIFNVKKVSSKPGRNPLTGAAITCAPSVRITFKPSSSLKDKMIAAAWAGKSRAVAAPAAAPAKKG
jgi:DNA-binding protein HU-beta